MMSNTMTIVVACVTLLTILHVLAEPPPPGSVQMRVVNHAGAPIELFWVNEFEPVPHPLVKQTTKAIRNNTDTTINSYDTHKFLIKFLKPVAGAETYFRKGPKEEVITVSYELQPNGEKMMFAKQVTKYDEVMMKVQNATDACMHLKDQAFDECFAAGVVQDVVKLEETKQEITKYRNLMSERLRNYTCEDDTMVTSKPLHSKPYFVEGEHFTVDMLFENAQAKIWTVRNFIKDNECDVLERHATPLLRRATVAAEDGTSIVSENRKAQQAGYDKHQKDPNDPLVDLHYRVLSMTNAVAGYDLQPEGQEDFTVIQYNVDDQYTPHCDGTCNGDRHIPAGRVATAVMYCRVATRGGGTTFTKADVFVKPERGQATFFSYKGADGYMEDGFTEHSGCPVLEGEKWITTSWMREGVTAENPWTSYDPSGVPIQEDGTSDTAEINVDGDEL